MNLFRRARAENWTNNLRIERNLSILVFFFSFLELKWLDVKIGRFAIFGLKKKTPFKKFFYRSCIFVLILGYNRGGGAASETF